MGIETSCDETSVAIVVNGIKILSNVVASQMNIHEKFGGIVPEIASRKHMEKILPTFQAALQQSKKELKDINAIAVVNGPGLKGSLLVGLSFAKAIAYVQKIPLVAVNHIEGHIYANYLNQQNIETPFLALIVSGGHTSLILVEKMGCFKIIGQTRDDAAGEVFDKIGKYLDLGYPGGPLIEKRALLGNATAFHFPRPLKNAMNFDFSFSGLKTAVIYFLKKQTKNNDPISIDDICASFQQAVIDTLLIKTFSAVREKGVKRLLIGGGVAANESLRKQFFLKAKEEKVEIHLPPKNLCTDNAAMIASAGYYKINRGISSTFDIDVYTKR